MKHSAERKYIKYKYQNHIVNEKKLYTNPFNQITFKYAGINERIRDMKKYFEMHVQPDDILPSKSLLNLHPTNATEERNLDTDFTAFLWIHESNGREHNIFKEHYFTVNHELPFQSLYHRHNYIEIFYVIDGDFEQILLGEKRRFSAGDVVITDKNCEHADYITEDTGTILFFFVHPNFLDRILYSYDSTDHLHHFLFEALRSRRNEQSFLHFKPETSSRDLEFIFEQLIYEDYTCQTGSRDIIKWNLIRMFQVLCQKYALQEYSSRRENKEKVLLYEVERYIHLHLSDVTIHHLETQFHYHRNYYNLLLKKYRSQSFRDYVQTLRMNQAAWLLSTTNLPIKDIAEQVGYENSSFFYHLFERYFKEGPQAYRMGSENFSEARP